MPIPAGAQQTSLDAVSCAAPDACVAVGSYYVSADAQEGLAERWDGTTWTSQDLGPATTGAAPSGVSCPAAGYCVAAGSTATGPVVLAWDGTAWHKQPVPLPSGAEGVVFNAVSCASPASCVATGVNPAAGSRNGAANVQLPLALAGPKAGYAPSGTSPGRSGPSGGPADGPL